MNTQPLHSHIAKTIARNLVLAALLLGSFLTVQAAQGDSLTIAPAEVPLASVKTPEAIQLLSRHDCWTGEAPKHMEGVLPGHVVVTVNGNATLGGERMVGKALEQIFNNGDHGLTVHGFCE